MMPNTRSTSGGAIIAPSAGLTAANKERRQRQTVRGLVHQLGNRFAVRKRGLSPVLRTSREAGSAELRKWREQHIFSAIEKEKRLQQIFAWSDEHKPKGKAWGLLTPKEKIILQVMYDARCYVTGRLDFAYSQICAMAKCCSQTLSAAIKKFEHLGLVEKWRRMVPIDDPEPGGPRYTQINNAYFLRLPAAVATRVRAALERLTKIVTPPVPAPREPTAHEIEALAATKAKAAGADDREAAARQAHYADGMVEAILARGRKRFGPTGGDSSI